MNRRRLAGAILAAGSVVLIAAAPASASTGDAAVGVFRSRLVGASTFTQVGTTVYVFGAYRGLPPNSTSYTVIYGNSVCDPAQAFPVGPFQADANGRAVARFTVTAPAGLVAGTMSVSVRRADVTNQGVPTDLDHDGLTGPGDVVAVAGQPRIGLRECDRHPRLVHLPVSR